VIVAAIILVPTILLMGYLALSYRTNATLTPATSASGAANLPAHTSGATGARTPTTRPPKQPAASPTFTFVLNIQVDPGQKQIDAAAKEFMTKLAGRRPSKVELVGMDKASSQVNDGKANAKWLKDTLVNSELVLGPDGKPLDGQHITVSGAPGRRGAIRVVVFFAS
jgi:hypothetical protein